MSRTDSHTPEWVRTLHAAHDGQPTFVNHSPHCEEYDGWPYKGPRDFVVRRVARAEAEANGWDLSPAYASLHGIDHVYARVPHGPFPCDADSSRGRCTRLRGAADRHRWYVYAPTTHERLHLHYFGPERAAVRDSLRDAVKDYRGSGHLVPKEDGGWEPEREAPTRQTRHATWAGGWWD